MFLWCLKFWSNFQHFFNVEASFWSPSTDTIAMPWLHLGNPMDRYDPVGRWRWEDGERSIDRLIRDPRTSVKSRRSWRLVFARLRSVWRGVSSKSGCWWCCCNCSIAPDSDWGASCDVVAGTTEGPRGAHGPKCRFWSILSSFISQDSFPTRMLSVTFCCLLRLVGGACGASGAREPKSFAQNFSQTFQLLWPKMCWVCAEYISDKINN